MKKKKILCKKCKKELDPIYAMKFVDENNNGETAYLCSLECIIEEVEDSGGIINSKL